MVQFNSLLNELRDKSASYHIAKDISLKMNLIAWIEFWLDYYYYVQISHINNLAPWNSFPMQIICLSYTFLNCLSLYHIYFLFGYYYYVIYISNLAIIISYIFLTHTAYISVCSINDLRFVINLKNDRWI